MNALDHLQMLILCGALTGIGVVLLEWDGLLLLGLIVVFLCGPFALGSLLTLVFHRWLPK